MAAGPSSDSTPTQMAVSSSPSDFMAHSASKASRSVASSPAYSAAAGRARSHRVRTACPLSTGTGGRISSTLRPQWVARPAVSASAASPSSRVREASSSGVPRQWKATIGPLSSIRTRSTRSSGVSCSPANSRTRPSQVAKAGTVVAAPAPGSSSSAPWEPA